MISISEWPRLFFDCLGRRNECKVAPRALKMFRADVSSTVTSRRTVHNNASYYSQRSQTTSLKMFHTRVQPFLMLSQSMKVEKSPQTWNANRRSYIPIHKKPFILDMCARQGYPMSERFFHTYRVVIRGFSFTYRRFHRRRLERWLLPRDCRLE